MWLRQARREWEIDELSATTGGGACDDKKIRGRTLLI
jgi:hypothetical protein